MIGRGAAVFMTLKVLKYIIIAVKWKLGGSVPTQYLVCSVNQQPSGECQQILAHLES